MDSSLSNNINLLSRHWYVFYTSPRAEKIAYRELTNLGFETFLPISKTIKIWRNRQRKVIEEPLFPGYIFLRIHSSKISDVLRVPKICTCIKTSNIPAIVPERDIEAIKIMQCLEASILNKRDYSIGEKVQIINGPLCGYSGILIKDKNKFGVLIDSINLMATVNIDPSDLKIIE